MAWFPNHECQAVAEVANGDWLHLQPAVKPPACSYIDRPISMLSVLNNEFAL